MDGLLHCRLTALHVRVISAGVAAMGAIMGGDVVEGWCWSSPPTTWPKVLLGP